MFTKFETPIGVDVITERFTFFSKVIFSLKVNLFRGHGVPISVTIAHTTVDVLFEAFNFKFTNCSQNNLRSYRPIVLDLLS